MKEYHMKDRFIIDVSAFRNQRYDDIALIIGRIILKKLVTSKCLVIPFEATEDIS